MGAAQVEQVWFIAYRNPLRPDEAGLKFVHGEIEAMIEERRLEAQGYAVLRVLEMLPRPLDGHA